MSDFLALSWNVADPEAAGRASRLAVEARAEHWVTMIDQPGWLVISAPPRPGRSAPVVQNRAVVIGTVFDRAASQVGLASPLPDITGDPVMIARQLVRDRWGAYVFLAKTAAGTLHVLRDPIGMLDGATWLCGDLRIVSSRPELFVVHAPPCELDLDLARLADLLVFPGSAGEASALLGLEAVPPGALLSFGPRSRSTEQLWRPADWARRSASADPACLRAVTDQCTAAWQRVARRGIAELSADLTRRLSRQDLPDREPIT